MNIRHPMFRGFWVPWGKFLNNHWDVLRSSILKLLKDTSLHIHFIHSELGMRGTFQPDFADSLFTPVKLGIRVFLAFPAWFYWCRSAYF